ncbi:cupin domain-containing protein [Pararhodonellum marinum]|uniref:phosphoheptose isomerase n=1 Tax=Pararhodonellum marinum TaxID=2755358 RepID=UPI00188F5EEF|nr:phosphoheptose isomerase [Pararhodonellum marinum]
MANNSWNLNISQDADKSEVFQSVEAFLNELGLGIASKDMERPWGGFFVIQEDQIKRFKSIFFDDVFLDEHQMQQKLSPKILLVGPDKRLSWQYHHRRAEIWKLIAGNAGIVVSPDDRLNDLKKLELGKVIRLSQGERHRLVGLTGWGIVAEIWMHTDPDHPSDESDIVRVEDDFQRT